MRVRRANHGLESRAGIAPRLTRSAAQMPRETGSSSAGPVTTACEAGRRASSKWPSWTRADFTAVFREPFSTNLFSHLGDESPVQTKTGPMAANDGFRSNHDERSLPGGPTPASKHLEQFVKHAELWLGMLALQHGELLSECQILQKQASARTKDANKYSEPEPEPAGHGREL